MKDRSRYPFIITMLTLLAVNLGIMIPFSSTAEANVQASSNAVRVGVGARYYPGHVYRPYWWGWNGWGRGSTVFGSHMRGLAQLRVATARAHYQMALARQEYVRAAAFYRLMEVMANYVWRLKREKNRLVKERKKLDSYLKTLNALKIGKVTSRVISAFFYFENLPGFYELPAMQINGGFVGPFPVEDFVLSSTKVKTVEEYPGGDLIDFLNWMRTRPYKLALKSSQETPTAWQVLRQVAVELRGVVHETQQVLKEQYNQSTEDLIEMWGDEIWNSQGMLRNYRSEFQRADALRH